MIASSEINDRGEYLFFSIYSPFKSGKIEKKNCEISDTGCSVLRVFTLAKKKLNNIKSFKYVFDLFTSIQVLSIIIKKMNKKKIFQTDG